MTEQDRGIFAEGFHALCEAFSEPISDIRIEAYFSALDDYPIQAVVAGVKQALRSCKFFPRPVDLRELITGQTQANADGAWSEMLREIRRVGYCGTPRFSDDRTLATIVDVWGSWVRLCETLPGEGPELVGWMKQFKTAYHSNETRGQHAALLSDLDPAVQELIRGMASKKAMPKTGAERRAFPVASIQDDDGASE